MLSRFFLWNSGVDRFEEPSEPFTSCRTFFFFDEVTDLGPVGAGREEEAAATDAERTTPPWKLGHF